MRYAWVDVYRGLAVLFMTVLHFFVDLFPSQPIGLLVYSVKGGISIGDMDLAMFLFISGVSMYYAVAGRADKKEALKRARSRYFRIFWLGIALDFLLILFAGRIWWVFEAIGLSGIIALAFICFSDRMKLLSIAVIGLSYSYITSNGFVYGQVAGLPNGGFFGPFALSAIVLLGYMCAEHISRKKMNFKLFTAAGAALVVLGFILSLFVTYDRNVATFPYVVLSSGFCILVMVALYWLGEVRRVSSRLLEDFGRSALLVFSLNYPVLILAVNLRMENSFSVLQSAAITLVIVALLALASEVYLRTRR